MPTLLTRNTQEAALDAIVARLERGDALLPESPTNVMEVVGILKSYGVVLGEYWRNLVFIADAQFLQFFQFFKYCNGDRSLAKLLRHWNHDRINYEFSEYCMKAMLWHGGGGLDRYLDTPAFRDRAEAAVRAKFRRNPFALTLHRLFPEFAIEQVRQMCYYRALGVFWSVMSPMFLTLSDRYDRGEIRTIRDVVEHILDGLVAAAAMPITYSVAIDGQEYEIVPASEGLQFLADAAVPYVEAVFFRSFPFRGTVSYNAQAGQISDDPSRFNYGALYADPLPVGGSGIPPTLLMQDMRHYLPEYLRESLDRQTRGEEDLRVKICIVFQKSMFCVTTAAILGLAPHPYNTDDEAKKQENRLYFRNWLDRLADSRLLSLQNL